MKEHATILHIENNIALVEVGKNASCESCSEKGGCINAKGKASQFRAYNVNGLDLQPGETVEVNVAPGKAVSAAFMVLGMPLVLFFIAYWAIGEFFPGVPEGLAALIGLSGLVGGFGLNFLLKNQYNAKENLPVIEKKVSLSPNLEQVPQF